MARAVFSLFLSFLVGTSALANAPLERSFSEGYLGEKNPSTYSGPWQPVFHHDAYFGRYSWDDEQFFGGYFYPYIWRTGPEWSRFFSEEVMGASACPHPILSKNFDEIRYAHRLLALSYLLEIIDNTRNDLVLLKRPDQCKFDLQELLKSCRPKSKDMKTFINNLSAQKPYSAPVVGKDHNFATFQTKWLSSVTKSDASVAAARLSNQCKLEQTNCDGLQMEKAVPLMARACAEDRALFLEVCSEEDQLYGLSTSPLATYLLGTSNLMTLMNNEGYAQGCLRRFGQMMASKERIYPAFSNMQPVVYAALKQQWGERYPHGRAFVFGALKEFEQKGLANVFEPQVEKPAEKPAVVAKPVEKPVEKPVVVEKPVEPVVVVAPKVEKKQEVAVEVKSAFLQASEIRKSQDIDRVDVDMLKFRYDYVFSMAELQLLGDALKDYTKREALEEMRSWDKLGAKEAPVPLTFLKYLIDAQHHQGLYNLTGVLGDKFWVSNDIDEKYKPAPEYIEFRNDPSTGNSWQIYVVRPE